MHGNGEMSDSELNDINLSSLEKIDLVEVAVSHIHWRAVLKRYIEGDLLSVREIRGAGNHQTCALGHWLTHISQPSFGKLPLVRQLMADHEEFHQHATSIVSYVNEGLLGEAEQELNHEFSRFQRRLLMRITELNELLRV
jgi:hypothetical protein